MTEIVRSPTWFDAPCGTLAGWVHLPADRRVRAGVVLCQSIGRESILTYQAIRMLADRLAGAGLLALRFDYKGTGDSSGSLDDGVPEWVASIQGALQFVRSAGCAEVSLVGLRMGATLAAVGAAGFGPLSTVVLWDPVVSGRTFLRQQRALQTVEIGPRPSTADRATEALGFVYPEHVVRQLQGVRLRADLLNGAQFGGPEDGRCLLLTRPEDAARSPLDEMASTAGVVQRTAGHQDGLMDRRSFAVEIPRATVADIVEHIDRWARGRAVDVRLEVRNSARVDRTADGAEIVERFVRLGPRDAFGVVTELAGASGNQPVLMCANVAKEHHIGPGRAWVSLARQAAARGMAAVRYDAPGVGDSAGTEYDDPELYPRNGGGQAVDVVGAVVRQFGGPVGMVGSCSGAWQAAVAGAAAPLAVVWLINNAQWDPAPVPSDGRVAGAMLEELTQRGELPDSGFARAKRMVKRWMPYRLWLLLCRVGPWETPEPMLRALADNRVKIRLLLSRPDAETFEGRRGATAVVRLRRRAADVRVRVFEDMDHALFLRAGRDAALAEVLAGAAVDLGVDGPTKLPMTERAHA